MGFGDYLVTNQLLTTENINQLYTENIKEDYQRELDLVITEFDELIKLAVLKNLHYTSLIICDVWNVLGYVPNASQIFDDALKSLQSRGFSINRCSALGNYVGVSW